MTNGDDGNDDRAGDDVGGGPGSLAQDAPQQVADLAAACIRFVAARYAVTLDYTPETLSVLDQWLRDARPEARRAHETAELVQTTAGAYLGEVIRRAYGGEWLVASDYADWRLYLHPVYCAFNPIGMAREALTLATEDGWHAHFELDPAERDAIHARLEALPQVEEDEYFAPSTRFDVVSIVVDALLEGQRSRGLGDVTFAPEDYESHHRLTNGKI